MNTTIEITKETQKENQSNTIKENNMNIILTKDEYLKTIQSFKEIFNNKDLRKKKKFHTHTYVANNKEFKSVTCEIQPGLLQLQHFIFYRILRNKNPEKAVHSVESQKYKDVMWRFNFVKNNNIENSTVQYVIKNIQKGFPDLSDQQIQEIIKSY